MNELLKLFIIMGQQEGVASGFDMFENDTKKVQEELKIIRKTTRNRA